MSTLKPVLLLGAGASIDAGLPSSLALTREVHDFLVRKKVPEARLFAYIVSKLIVRRVRQGGSPFAPIDIETAYDAVKNFLSKDSHVLAEFVSGWDAIPTKEITPARFDANVFQRNLGDLVRARRGRSLSRPDEIHVSIDRFAVSRLAGQLERSFGTLKPEKYNLSVYIEALSDFLTPRESSYRYVEQICEHSSNHFDCVATLNYDLLLENSCKERGISYDYGLKNWNLRRYVKFDRSEIHLIKLHGSLNWYFKGEDEIEISEGSKPSLRRGLIFGGQEEKLFSDGPFLALRQHVFDRMRQSNVLLVCGYSFSDHHINAMIRSWAATRRKAKMVVVNPNLDGKALSVLSKCQRRDSDGKFKHFVQLRLFEKGMAEVVRDVLDESLSPVVPEQTDYSEQLASRLAGGGRDSAWTRAQQ